jgi:hypothetical protein
LVCISSRAEILWFTNSDDECGVDFGSILYRLHQLVFHIHAVLTETTLSNPDSNRLSKRAIARRKVKMEIWDNIHLHPRFQSWEDEKTGYNWSQKV